MKSGSSNTNSEGLKIARLLMVLSSISPLFILWAIRGNSLVPNNYFIGFCLLMVVLPNVALLWRFQITKDNKDKRKIIVGEANDNRDHILVYLFAMLLPFYSEDISTMRELLSTIAALIFIIFLFWHLNLHYMNLLFAIRGYRVFTVYPPIDGNKLSGRTPQVLITHRVSLAPDEEIIGYRISNTVILEEDS